MKKLYFYTSLDQDLTKADERSREAARELLSDESRAFASTHPDWYVIERLERLAELRDAAADEIRNLAVWGANHGLSTHKLGGAAGISNATVGRWLKADAELAAVVDDEDD